MAELMQGQILRILLVTTQQDTEEKIRNILTNGRFMNHRLHWVAQPNIANVRARDLLPHIILVDDVLYSMITDLQVRERPLSGEVVVQEQQTNARQGTATSLRQNVSGGEVNWKTYRTRIVSTANKANLEFDEARAPLEDGLYRSISGIFAN